jgi:dUTP pyrophosphatase
MKLKVFVKRFKNEAGEPLVDFPKIIRKGDWIDLRAAEEVNLTAPQAGTLKGHDVKHRDVVSKVTYIPLGIAVKLPDGFEAPVVSRSHIAEKLGIICANSIGIIDNSYQGNDDQWHFAVIPIRKTAIPRNTRICQFRIQLSQKATLWQKLKWLFTSGIELVEVNSLDGENRGGLGSTGI